MRRNPDSLVGMFAASLLALASCVEATPPEDTVSEESRAADQICLITVGMGTCTGVDVQSIEQDPLYGGCSSQPNAIDKLYTACQNAQQQARDCIAQYASQCAYGSTFKSTDPVCNTSTYPSTGWGWGWGPWTAYCNYQAYASASWSCNMKCPDAGAPITPIYQPSTPPPPG
jgi:hypothetical protein